MITLSIDRGNVLSLSSINNCNWVILEDLFLIRRKRIKERKKEYSIRFYGVLY